MYDHVELEFEPLAIGLGRCFVAGDTERHQSCIEADPRRLAQRGDLAGAVGGEGRQDRLARLRDEGAAPGDDQRVVAGLRQIGEQRAHFRRRAEIMLGRQALAIVIGDRAALRDAHQRVVRLVEVAVGKIGVVGRDQWQVMGVGEIDETGLAARLFRHAVPLQFDVEPVGEHCP